MSEQRKKRLVGFLVIVSIAVIVLPMLLDGQGYKERQALEVSIPPPPEPLDFVTYTPKNKPLESTKELPPARPLAQQNKSTSAVAVPQAKKLDAVKKTTAAKQQITLAIDKPVLDIQGVPVAWTLQLASFKDAANASLLRNKLRDKGYKSYIRRKGDLNKVFVGPDIQRSEIEILKSQLQKEFKLNGLILRFTTS